ncbi:MAG: ATP-binding protein [Gammaproteobacteria bacterium]
MAGAYTGLLQGINASWWSDFFWTTASFAAALRCFATARNRGLPHERRAWNFFGTAALSWFTGMLVWDFYEIFAGVLVPFPSIADWFFLGYPVFFTAGVFYFRAQMPTRQYNMIQIANLGLIISTIIVLCFIVLSHALQQSDKSLYYESFALSHALFNFTCFVFAVYCYWFYVWRDNRPSFRLMLLALLLFALTDTLYGMQLLGESFSGISYLNIYWLVAFALQYWAAFEQDLVISPLPQKTDARGMPRAQKYEAIMPALCLFFVVAVSLIFKDRLNETTYTVMTIAAITFAVFLTLREWQSNSLELNLMSELQAAKTELEQRVEQRTAELSDAIEELEAFSYSVSHDLRAPLRAINGFSQALEEDYAKQIDETGNDYLQRIRQGTEKMSNLIDALLTLSRISRHSIKRKTVSLDQIAENILQQLQELDPDRKIDLNIEKGISAYGDEYLLRIVLQNLLGNAWKYSSKIQTPRIEFGYFERNSSKIYYIRDNGAGFDMKYYNKLFDAFQRLHGNEFEGTGIGLATVRRCIRRHNGRIWAESDVNNGATFYFTLASSATR